MSFTFKQFNLNTSANMLLFPAFSVLPCKFPQFNSCNVMLQSNNLLTPNPNHVRLPIPNRLPSFKSNIGAVFRKRTQGALRSSAGEYVSDFVDEESTSGFDWDDELLEVGDVESPWKEAVIYKRNPSVSHSEYCTTLESLGLGNLSTDVSKSRASVMGLRVTRAVKDYPDGTPVMVSLDVTRKKQKLRLDGIVRTVITVGCNRCGEPAGKSIFSNFTILLTEEPISELETINMGIIYGEEKFRASGNSDEEDEDGLIDLDDQLHFPPEENEVDISKQIRDLVHVEITIDGLCDQNCKGLCLRCGVNLNRDSCRCRMQEVDKKGYGPLGNLRKQMQQS